MGELKEKTFTQDVEDAEKERKQREKGNVFNPLKSGWR